MSHSLRISPEAVVDLTEAAHWYDHQRVGLGANRLDAVQLIFSQVVERPDSFARMDEPVRGLALRRALVPGFPYAVIFLADPAAVHIFAVAHTSCRPDYWSRRVTS